LDSPERLLAAENGHYLEYRRRNLGAGEGRPKRLGEGAELYAARFRLPSHLGLEGRRAPLCFGEARREGEESGAPLGSEQLLGRLVERHGAGADIEASGRGELGDGLGAR